ncbi:MAG: chloride channel protein, partial [Deltaproteobacteria bacterium]
MKNFAPEAKGHGVPEVMDAIYYGEGKIRPVVAVIKSVASAICIGSGGSVGREGPIIQIGSAFGSTLGQIIRIPHSQRNTLIATGAGAGIAATFNAPLGGVAFAMELLLVSINASNVLPVALGTGTAAYVGRALLGTKPSFYFPPLQVPDFRLADPGFLFLFVPFGAMMGLVTFLFVRGIYWTEDRFDSMPGNEYTRHLSGMLVVGIMIYLMRRHTGLYYVEGVGYATIMDILRGTLTDPFFLILLFALKYFATCLTLGSGGSGGIFSPALFMGATLGGMFGHTAQLLFPQINIIPESFVAAGMAAGFGGSTGAIITAAVMVLEMTEDANATLPIIITVSIALGVRAWLSPGSIYTLKLTRRGHPVPEGLE